MNSETHMKRFGKFAVANRPSDVVHRIHVYVHLDVELDMLFTL